MPDNVDVTAGAGTTLRTDDVAGVHYQGVKLYDGTADSTVAIVSTADGDLYVINNGGTTLAAQVTVTNSTTQLVPARGGRHQVTLINYQTVPVYIGATAATTSMLRLNPGDSITLISAGRIDGITSAAYSASGDAKVHTIEVYA